MSEKIEHLKQEIKKREAWIEQIKADIERLSIEIQIELINELKGVNTAKAFELMEVI